MTISQIRPDLYNTVDDKLYSCIVCGNQIISEQLVKYDKNGNPVVYYAPASRYFCADGIFCGIECSFKWYEDKLNGQ